ISSMQPAIAIDGFRGGERIIQVPAHDAVAAYQYLARLSRADLTSVPADALDFQAGHRTSAGPGDTLDRITRAAHTDDSAFSHAVSGNDCFDSQLLLHALDQHRGHAGRAGHRDSQARELARALALLRQERLEEGGWARYEGDAPVLDQIHCLRR